MAHMYKNEKTLKEVPTWNPFKGCGFDCIYCEPSFKRQAKRQKHNCMDCYNYVPHFHPERLDKIPSGELVFACANGDIDFADVTQLSAILKAMKSKPKQTFLLQTKSPLCLNNWKIPCNVIVGTTIETNRDTKHISKAPNPCIRYHWMHNFQCRKAVTIEPILDFDLNIMVRWIEDIDPEIVWVGYANHTSGLVLDEPELSKTEQLVAKLSKFTDVRLKTMRDKIGTKDQCKDELSI